MGPCKSYRFYACMLHYINEDLLDADKLANTYNSNGLGCHLCLGGI